MPIDYNKCDVITWSWQKVLGGEAAHGMLSLSPRAVERLNSHKPSWPIPKIFRLSSKSNVLFDIFKGATINTPSMLCVEDALDSLNWVDSIGGLNELFKRSDRSLSYVSEWIENTSWVKFLNPNISTRSNTSITFTINEDWFLNMDTTEQKDVMNKICTLLSNENVALEMYLIQLTHIKSIEEIFKIFFP